MDLDGGNMRRNWEGKGNSNQNILFEKNQKQSIVVHTLNPRAGEAKNTWNYLLSLFGKPKITVRGTLLKPTVRTKQTAQPGTQGTTE